MDELAYFDYVLSSTEVGEIYNIYDIGTAALEPATANEYFLTPDTNCYRLGVAQGGSPQGFCWGNSGKRLYVISATGDNIIQYNADVAYDMDSIYFHYRYVLSLNSIDTAPRACSWSSDGLTLYVTGDTGNLVMSLTASTAWEVDTLGSSTTQSLNTISTPHSSHFN